MIAPMLAVCSRQPVFVGCRLDAKQDWKKSWTLEPGRPLFPIDS